MTESDCNTQWYECKIASFFEYVNFITSFTADSGEKGCHTCERTESVKKREKEASYFNTFEGSK